MRVLHCIIFGLLVFSAFAAPAEDDGDENSEEESSEEEEVEEELLLPLAEPCDPEECKLPDCRCYSTEIPGGLPARDTPQFILLTFDDNINILNIETYKDLLFDRTNANQCKIGVTFFTNHEYGNYQLINEVYNHGFEIAMHSVSHQTSQPYWAHASYDDMVREFVDQRKQLAHFANIPASSIQGIRHPFLQMTGNSTYHVMKDHGILYDSSWGTVTNIDPGLWPYTLDYLSGQECMVGPCPTASLPGVWISPMVAWLDVNGTPCSMVDSCYSVPDLTDGDAWFEFIVKNFERHYMGNRAPFGFYVHEWYVRTYPGVQEGLRRFIDLVTQLNDAFMVNTAEVIEWTRNPIPLDEYMKKPCKAVQQTGCPASNCGPLYREGSMEGYWMSICNTCPNVYPWLGNPYGE